MGSLLARFQLSEGPSTPAPLAVQFTSEGSTLSSCDIELVGAGYRFSLIKKRFAAGRCLAGGFSWDGSVPDGPLRLCWHAWDWFCSISVTRSSPEVPPQRGVTGLAGGRRAKAPLHEINPAAAYESREFHGLLSAHGSCVKGKVWGSPGRAFAPLV